MIWWMSLEWKRVEAAISINNLKFDGQWYIQ